ncbi:MAG TPA: methyltransferase domain-containing protein [Frankiaceae bacterium]|nr:methyltransferase domain-containing protein [Frankiaceae bacterium]
MVWDALVAALGRVGPGPLTVLDAGGGTGGFSVPLAGLGHRVTVVDPSPDSLAALERRATEEGVAAAITGVQGDLSSLLDHVAPGTVDVVLCHSVLEVVDDPAAGVAAVAAAVRTGGLASVVAANRTAAVVSRALAGRFAEAEAALDDPAGRWGAGDAAQRRFGRAELVTLLADAGLVADEVHGVRVFTDLVPGALLDSDAAAFEALVRLETAVAGRDPYRDVATQLHVLATRTV